MSRSLLLYDNEIKFPLTTLFFIFIAYRLTMLFSATETTKMEALTTLLFKKNYYYIGVDDHNEQATVENLVQGYVCGIRRKIKHS